MSKSASEMWRIRSLPSTVPCPGFLGNPHQSFGVHSKSALWQRGGPLCFQCYLCVSPAFKLSLEKVSLPEFCPNETTQAQRAPVPLNSPMQLLEFVVSLTCDHFDSSYQTFVPISPIHRVLPLHPHSALPRAKGRAGHEKRKAQGKST